MDIKPPAPDANLELIVKGAVALGTLLWGCLVAAGKYILGSYDKRLKAVEARQETHATKEDLHALGADIKGDIRELRSALFHPPGE